MTEDQMMIAHSFAWVETSKLQVISGCLPATKWMAWLAGFW